MKFTIFLTAVALIPASAQIAPMKPAPPAASAAGTIIKAETSPMSLQILRNFEKDIDGRIGATGTVGSGGHGQPCNVLTPSRGIYVAGMGAVFTSEVELASTPGGIGIFQTATPELKAKVRKDKLANVPLLEKTLSDMVLTLVASPALKLAENDQIVVAARLTYRAWEDTTGMPGQILAHLDRRGGVVKVEVQ
jgi:hypothetical protein